MSRYDQYTDAANVTSSVRLGDRDREELADFFGDMFSQGYLTRAEFEARKDRVMTAVTRDQVHTLAKDLPFTVEGWKAKRQAVATVERMRAEKKQPVARSPWRRTVGVLCGMVLLGCAVVDAVMLPPSVGVMVQSALLLVGAIMMMVSEVI